MTTGNKSSSSTDLARQIFREVLVPLASGPHGASLEFAQTPHDGSYFRRPRRACLSRADMEAMGASGELEALASLWRQEGRHALLVLIPELQKLAEAVAAERAAGAQSPDQPSRLIYQMY